MSVNASVKCSLLEDSESSRSRGKYNDYTSKERALIGKYAAENGPAKATRHFSQLLGRKVPETTARRLKSDKDERVSEG